MTWTAHVDTAAVAALLAGLAGLAVPLLIARLPEPEPEEAPAEAPEEAPEPEPGPGGAVGQGPPKELYADLAARPGLGRRSALVAALGGGLVGAALGWVWPLAFLLPLVPLLVALSVVDLRTRLLPTPLIRLCYLVTVLGVLLTWVATRATDDLLRAAIGWLVAGLVYFVLWFVNPRGMGYGDVRLSGVLGLALGQLGWGELMVGIYSGFLVFGLPGLVLALVRWDRDLLRSAYPFGPFMIIGALLGVVTGGPLWSGLVTG